MDQRVFLKDLFNSHLVHDGVRDAYLDCGKNIEDRMRLMLKKYPDLKLHIKDDFAYFLSKNELNSNDVNSKHKIGKLLGYANVVPIDKLNRKIDTYVFTFEVCGSFGKLILFRAQEQTMEAESHYEDFLKKIKISLGKLRTSGSEIYDVKLDICHKAAR